MIEAKKEFLKYIELGPSDKEKITKWITSCQNQLKNE